MFIGGFEMRMGSEAVSAMVREYFNRRVMDHVNAIEVVTVTVNKKAYDEGRSDWLVVECQRKDGL